MNECLNWTTTPLSCDQLMPGVRLVALAADRERLKCSSGTAPSSVNNPRFAEYEAGAWLPKSDWRRLRHDELAKLQVASPVDDTALSFITLLQLEERLAGPLLAHAEWILAGGASDSIRAVRATALRSAVANVCEEFASPEEPVHCPGISVTPPGYRTATLDPDVGLRAGLHIDCYSQLPLTRRADVANRMVVNLGREARQFVFINLPVSQIVAMIKPTNVLLDPSRPNSVARAFMAQFSSYPVLSLEIKPGEAYIAPTENIVHDGSTELMTQTDVFLTLVGRFPLAKRVRPSTDFLNVDPIPGSGVGTVGE